MKKKRLAAAVILSAILFSMAEASLAKLTKANPIINVYRDVLPPEDAQSPIVTIYAPANGSFCPRNVTLLFDVSIPQGNNSNFRYEITEIYYKASWEAREITYTGGYVGVHRSIDLSDACGGNLSVTIYAVGVGYIQTGEEYRRENNVLYSYHYYDRFQLIGYSTVSFIKDVVSPQLTVLSLQNKTYATSAIELILVVNEPASQILYSIDGMENQTTPGNITLTGLPRGPHNLTVYAADLAGNTAVSETIFFNVEFSDFLPIAAVTIATVAIVGLGLALHLKKRRNKPSFEDN
ncbi:MAG: hypothetical protein NWF09_04945 [Candidatus Bathyarchaeota archaeon]|nr:hypothetical protein [Candidatus Bathyarchaeota archaeon]